MATMYSLFLGLLFVAVFILGGVGDHAVSRAGADSQEIAGASLLDLSQSIGSASGVAGGTPAAKCDSGISSTNEVCSYLIEIAADQLSSEQTLRAGIIKIAGAEIGVCEASGYNDGARVEEYLAYTGLDKGHAWCAAFVSWCYGQAGRSVPRNAWSPALFPSTRRYTDQQVRTGSVKPADLFGIYNAKLGRIDHVGLVRKRAGNWLLTIEGNVDNRVLSKRRSVVTIHAFSNWLEGG